MRTFFFEKYATLGHDYRHVSINEAFAMFVGKGDGHIGIFDADIEWDAEDSARGFCAKEGN